MRTAYSASVSDFTRVILMSPYISESSGQYLEHFTCEEKMGWGFGSAKEPSGRAGAQTRRMGWGPYPAHLHQFGYHHDAGTVLLPHHAPEVVHHLLLGPCGTKERPPGMDGQRRDATVFPLLTPLQHFKHFFPQRHAVLWGSRRSGSCSTLLRPRLAPNWPAPSLPWRLNPPGDETRLLTRTC